MGELGDNVEPTWLLILHSVVTVAAALLSSWLAVRSTRKLGKKEREEALERIIEESVERHTSHCVLQDMLQRAIEVRKIEVPKQIETAKREMLGALEVAVQSHKLECPFGERITRAMEEVKEDLEERIRLEKVEREEGRTDNRDRIEEMREELAEGQQELKAGQKEISLQLGSVVVTITKIEGHMETMDSERHILADEVKRIRDKQNGVRR